MKTEEFFQIIGELDERRVAAAGEAMTERKHNIAPWLKRSAIAACLCLAAVGISVPFLSHHSDIRPQKQPDDLSSEVSAHTNHDPERPTSTQNSDMILVNQAEQVSGADMDIQISHYDQLSKTEKADFLQDFEAAAGMSFAAFSQKLPDTYVQKAFYSVNVPADTDRTAYIPHDYVLEYQNPHGGRAIIAICPAEKPLRDHYIMYDDPKPSEINGISTVIYGYQDTFIAEFTHMGIYYDIETSGVTLEELTDLLHRILE